MEKWILTETILNEYPEVDILHLVLLVRNKKVVAYDVGTGEKIRWDVLINEFNEVRSFFTESNLADGVSRKSKFKKIYQITAYLNNNENQIPWESLHDYLSYTGDVPINKSQYLQILKGWEYTQESYYIRKAMFKESEIKPLLPNKDGESSNKASSKALLKFIGALLIIHYNKPCHLKEDNSMNVDSIAKSFSQGCASSEINNDGIGESTVRKNIIAPAIEAIQPNLARKKILKTPT